jgi:hypothetical protein
MKMRLADDDFDPDGENLDRDGSWRDSRVARKVCEVRLE